MNSIDALLKRLEAAQGDTQAQAALTAGFMLLNQPEAQREPLRAALDAAAVLRWFDAGLIAKVLGIPEDDARQRFESLKSLPFIEVYRSGSNELYNVHESTRLGWRRQMAQSHLQRFRDLSLSASACFADEHTPAGRIEWLYQLLCGDPEKGATELENLNRAWSSSAHPEDHYALAATLKELEETRIAAGRARCWILMVIAWTREMRSETAQLDDIADDVLHLARECQDDSAEADAQCLLGNINQSKGKLGAAQVAYNKFLGIFRRLVEQDPFNIGWQRELAVALSKVGDVLLAQGKRGSAQVTYGENLAISRSLADLDPSNAGWQRDLAVAYSKQGDVLRDQGKPEAAQTAYDEYLAISRSLADLDPSNAGWQRDLAVAYSKQGNVLRDQGKLDAAQTAYDEYLAICRRLLELDPGNAGLQRELAVAYSKQGDVLQDQGPLDAAQAAYDEFLAIFRRLAELDPSNAGWQRELAVAHCKRGNLLRNQGRLDAAQAAYGEDLAISRRLAELDPGNADWQRDLAVALINAGAVFTEQGRLDDAKAAYKESLAILQRLTEIDPSNAVWRRDLSAVRSWLE